MAAHKSSSLLRNIPGVDRLLETAGGQDLCQRYGREFILYLLREVLDELRLTILDQPDNEDLNRSLLENDQILNITRLKADKLLSTKVLRAINATGVVLHTGLGRAVLAPDALEALQRNLSSYSLLEIDRSTGERGVRETAVRDLLRFLTGAESALIVNNNAAACTLVLAALTSGKEVIVSRGQLVEIGGSFRIPEVMNQSGATLREVGSTNRTHLRDYEQAIVDQTAALLLVHTSNYKVVGFHSEVDTDELAQLARRKNVLLLEDLGSGALIDFSRYGFEPEPTVRNVLEQGVDVAMFSGDKLLGGPQAGLIVGRADLIDTIRRHPLYRAFRVDKMTLSILEATLSAYIKPDQLAQKIPTFRMLTYPVDQIRETALQWIDHLRKNSPHQFELRADESRPGSGSLPAQSIPTWVVVIKPSGQTVANLARKLRKNNPPIFTRIQDDALLLDPRTVQANEEEELLHGLLRALPSGDTPAQS